MALLADELLQQLGQLKEGRILAEDRKEDAAEIPDAPPQRFIAVEESELSATDRVYFKRPLPEVPVLPDKYGSRFTFLVRLIGKGGPSKCMQLRRKGLRSEARPSRKGLPIC